MPAGYTRQAAAQIQPGLRANAEDVDAEYDALARAFDNAAGHDHSGSVAGDGAKISLTAGVVGVLPIANGGTGSSGGTAPVFANAQFNPGGVLVGSVGSIPGAGQLTLNANTSVPPAGGGGNLYVVGANSTSPVIQLDAFAGVGTIIGRQARGTAAFPSATQNGDWLLALDGVGYTGSSYQQGAQILLSANENWSPGARGTALYFATTPNGTTTAVNSLVVAGNNAAFSGVVTTGGNLNVNGGGGIAYTGFGGGGSDGGSHLYRFGWSGSHLVVSVDGTSGLQLANAGDLNGYLPLSGGTVSNLTVSGGLTVNGSGTAINVPNGAVISGTFLQANGSGTALYLPNGNISMGGGIVVTGNLGGGLSIHATNAVEADFFGTAFYAPNGNVTCIQCNANVFNNTSDATLKTDIADSGVGLDAVMRLAPRTFRWKAAPDREQLGLVAQEVEAVLPQAVSTSDGGGVHEPLMGIDYATITTALIGAVQELHVLLKALEAKCSTPA